MGPTSWFEEYVKSDTVVEVMETFEKQTFRNRCRIHNATGQQIVLTVPVGKVEHKQLTRDIEISYQTKWQHQHWMSLVSGYRNTPYFRYYEDYFAPLYEQQPKYLVDWNESFNGMIAELGDNHGLLEMNPQKEIRSTDWSGLTWTDKHPWQNETSVIERLFELGPEYLTAKSPHREAAEQH